MSGAMSYMTACRPHADKLDRAHEHLMHTITAGSMAQYRAASRERDALRRETDTCEGCAMTRRFWEQRRGGA